MIKAHNVKESEDGRGGNSNTMLPNEKKNEHDEDDISDTDRTEEPAQEAKVQAVGALPWNERPGNPPPGATPCLSAQVPLSLSDATTVVPVNLRKQKNDEDLEGAS